MLKRVVALFQVFFELNGVSREVRVFDRKADAAAKQGGGGGGAKRTRRADKSNSGHGTPQKQAPTSESPRRKTSEATLRPGVDASRAL